MPSVVVPGNAVNHSLISLLCDVFTFGIVETINYGSAVISQQMWNKARGLLISKPSPTAAITSTCLKNTVVGKTRAY
jgi:hypothetical protein